MNENILKAVDEYKRLQSRAINPDGYFDNAGRWYPDEFEKADCCKTVREPSRAYPYSLLTHCRTLKHICNKYNLDYSEVRKVMRQKIKEVVA